MKENDDRTIWRWLVSLLMKLKKNFQFQRVCLDDNHPKPVNINTLLSIICCPEHITAPSCFALYYSRNPWPTAWRASARYYRKIQHALSNKQMLLVTWQDQTLMCSRQRVTNSNVFILRCFRAMIAPNKLFKTHTFFNLNNCCFRTAWYFFNFNEFSQFFTRTGIGSRIEY
jgi:hypothetical protein